MAIEDMRKSHEIDSGDMRVAKRLKEWRAERKKQKSTEVKTFGGMFERGSMSVKEDVGAEPEAGKPAAQTGSNGGGSGGGGEQFERYSSMEELNADVAKMKDAISAAEYNNDRAQANILKKRLSNVETWLEEAKEKAVRLPELLMLMLVLMLVLVLVPVLSGAAGANSPGHSCACVCACASRHHLMTLLVGHADGRGPQEINAGLGQPQ